MRARTARGASRCRARGVHKMLQRVAAAQAAMVAPTQRIGAFAGGGVARDAEDGVVMSRRRQRRDGEALVRRAARAGAGLASEQDRPTRDGGASGGRGGCREGRPELGRRCSNRRCGGAARVAWYCHGDGRGARGARSLGARREPAPGS